MANPKHVEMLLKGADKWNRWRKTMPGWVDLVGAELVDIDLDGVNLASAYLSDANFENAWLLNAGFGGSNMHETNFHGANLENADFRYAKLEGAKITDTSLAFTNFQGALLKNADFHNSIMHGTLITETNLSEVNNLDFVLHDGPSCIGIDTIYRSQGHIPEKFLRGCGVPEDFITYMRSLTARAIEFYSCFISYSSKDEEFLKRLYADLQNAGVRSWFAAEDLKIGDKFRDRIDESIRLHDKLLLVLSENSVSSQWVEKEVETALEKERDQRKVVLFPVRLDDAVLEAKTGWAADIKRSRHIGDFREWKNHDSYRQAFERLMRDLKAEAGW